MFNRHKFALPAEQQAIRAKCFHPSGKFLEFPIEDVETSIPERFEKVVRLYPSQVAVKMGDHVLSYAELNATANRVGRMILKRLGSNSEPVGVLLGKSSTLISAMIGVLKAGKFFIMLDPSLPQRRIAAMMQDSQAELVISDRRNISTVREIAGDRSCVLEVESVDSTVLVDNVALSASPNDPAFIVYTSGSTGQPKGVIWNHRSMLHHTMLRTSETRVCEYDKIAVLSSGMGNTITDIFTGLLIGASLHLFDLEKESVQSLAHWLSREHISICPMSSPLFRQFCNTLAGRERFFDLRTIRLRSETIYRRDVELYKHHFPRSCTFVTGLASIETGLVRSYFVDHKCEVGSNEVPLGYPVEDKNVLLLDKSGRRVGLNDVGEIVIRSKYLASGYWNNPHLTAAKFKVNPNDPVKRLYFTGDLGLMLPDGCLIHKGRKDFRVKIRGYGVGLLEVEKALLSHPDIREAVVVAPKSELGEARLIAYYSCQSKSGPTISQLRRFLKNQFPDYMIPSTFVKLETMPLTLNGKVDRQALPVPDNSRSNLDVPWVGPRDSTEEKLVKVWAEVLGVDRVGIHDNFFDLGGHSLLTARLCIQIQKQFGNKLPEIAIYHAPTVAQFAKILVQDSWSAPWSLLAPLQPDGTKPPFFWAMEGDGDVRLVNYLPPNQPLYALVHQCRNGKRAIYHRLKDIAAHHLEEIRTIQPHGPYFLGGYCFGGMVAFEMAQQLQKQGDQVALLVLLDLADLHNCKTLRRQSTGSRESSPALGNRVFRHLGNLGRLSAKEKFDYVWVRVKATTRALIGWGDDIVKNLACKICWATGYPLSASLQGFNFHAVDSPILGEYEPCEYSGRAVLIKAKDSEWDAPFMRRLLTGEVEFHEVPGYHWDLRKEPFGRAWAEIVKASLEKAHNSLSASERHP